jgi:hypothetical protein
MDNHTPLPGVVGVFFWLDAFPRGWWGGDGRLRPRVRKSVKLKHLFPGVDATLQAVRQSLT